jgi:hypothetical protein
MRRARDPRWLTNKYRCDCAQCGASIPAGRDVWYNPNAQQGKRIWCAADACGGAQSRAFDAAVKVRLLRSMRSGAWAVEPLHMDGTSRRIAPWRVQPDDLLPLGGYPMLTPRIPTFLIMPSHAISRDKETK